MYQDFLTPLNIFIFTISLLVISLIVFSFGIYKSNYWLIVTGFILGLLLTPVTIFLPFLYLVSAYANYRDKKNIAWLLILFALLNAYYSAGVIRYALGATD